MYPKTPPKEIREDDEEYSDSHPLEDDVYLYEQEGGVDEQDEFADYFISQEAEWRQFEGDGNLKSRVGGARLINQELEGLIGLEVSEKVKKILTTPTLNFQAICSEIIRKYSDEFAPIYNSKSLNDLVAITSVKIDNIRFKNPKAYVLALCLFKKNKMDNSEIKYKGDYINKLDYLYEYIGNREDISKIDIIRYCFLIKSKL